MPEIIDPVFAKTSQNARFLLSENERFGLVFVKIGSINSGTGNIFEVRSALTRIRQVVSSALHKIPIIIHFARCALEYLWPLKTTEVFGQSL